MTNVKAGFVKEFKEKWRMFPERRIEVRFQYVDSRNIRGLNFNVFDYSLCQPCLETIRRILDIEESKGEVFESFYIKML